MSLKKVQNVILFVEFRLIREKKGAEHLDIQFDLKIMFACLYRTHVKVLIFSP